jgi:hypothetical protein
MWLRHQIQRIRAAFSSTAILDRSGSVLATRNISADASPAIYASIVAGEPLRQGEVLTGVIQRRRSFRSLGENNPELEEIQHPYVLVVSQDCDLEQDHRQRTNTEAPANTSDKLMPNVLLVQAVKAQELIAALPKGKDIYKRVIQNKDERYHVLQRVEPHADSTAVGVPALGIDFKRCFSVPTDELYVQLSSHAIRRTRLYSPYLEHFSKRFADFLNRVALPADHRIE